MILNKKGFSLIELMVVVAIIGILTTVAVPNYMRFQSKAKQTNAKSELSGIYGAEKAFYAEFDSYTGDLVLIGYVPDGIPLDGGGCPIVGSATNWPVRYYATGFGSTAPAVPTATSPTCAALNGGSAGTASLPSYDAKLANSTGFAGYNTQNLSTYSVSASPPTFTAGAYGKISGGATFDIWTINDSKQMINTASGL